MTQELTPKQTILKDASEKLEVLIQERAKAMPKNFNQTRFLQNCIAVMQDTKDIEKCTPISIARCMIKGAYLGLDFFRKECYAIPYLNTDTNQKELNFQTDYKGEIKLCRQYSVNPIQDIYANVVREGDLLEIRVEAGRQIVNFNPVMFNNKPIIGAFAVVVYKDGGMNYVAMSPEEIKYVRDKFSKAPGSPAWVKSEGEMFKKVPLRRLMKMINLEFNVAEQDEAFEEGALTTMDSTKRIIDTTVADPWNKKAETVDPDAELKASLKLKYPNEEEWQIEARIKESREQ